MPLFRFHKGSLSTSLETTVIVKNLNELKTLITDAMRGWIFIKDDEKVNIEIKPYPTISTHFDSRIGWYTHIVIARIEKMTACPIGFLSEPLQEII